MAVPLKLAKRQRMKQSICSSVVSISSFEDDEIEVSGILLRLPWLILEENSSPRFPFSWGSKRKRSAIHLSSSPSLRSSPPVPTLLPHLCNCEKPVVKVESSSPATPLSFSPSESDSRFNRSKRKSSKKKTKEELTQIVSHLSENIKLLKQELPKTKTHYEMLKDMNLKLKSRKRLLSDSLNQKVLNLNSETRTSMDPSPEPTDLSVPSPTPEEKEEEEEKAPVVVHQPASFIDHRITFGSEIFENSQYPCGQVSHLVSPGFGLDMAKHLSTISIPDLNFSVDEFSGLDYLHSFDLNRAAVAAQARKRRIEIKRVKGSMASVKPRCR